MSVSNKIKTGLEEAIAYEQGRTEARTIKLSVAPVDRYDADEIRAIRQSAGFTMTAVKPLPLGMGI